ncbi:RnfABCDGE type electron transport complex subunit D [Pseudomonas syringae]|uniref:Ion-translocating oxidoreductase complex subunit D n=1 Tax=Pseudomonas syringae TaxID=317 RepID=A0A9Q3X403_PSESX|nr:RnfABCDGE type electron transport complex subunit D [Pseudomonas syringae]MCF5062523.1 RnfABCDGE type electron transport complex subunit D [Pseudomonas syringae]MCF5076195.1 RnfABCDGE type electron transport complex subunit D [Pseudomonas syringae]MCF5118799.1 RnfABCDGE type electron transport complex subunit D [Pseudomonas syringae]MCF5378149.1 RnfABCDGE type electron transport complex subunit D [Pseudomonas syringae]
MVAADPQHALQRVLLATLPGVATLCWFYGWGVLINLALAGVCAVLVDAGAQRLRGRRVNDLSSLVTATLLALALPPYCPWWLCVAAVASGLLLGKHLYGGNRNPFNPAMVGYALMLIAFPQSMSHWPAAHGLDLLAGVQQVLGLQGTAPDAWAQATALDTLRTNNSLTIDELFARSPAFGVWGAKGSEWVGLAYLAGGLLLLQQRVISWHAPVGMLAGLFVSSMLFWNGSGSDSQGSPLFHLLSGATLLGAFFIVTEPVSGPRHPRARLLFGAGVGVLTYLIRTWGGYPDGVAFAVLLMNLAVPALERWVASTSSAVDA